MKIIAIAAVAKNGVIGKQNGLPWKIPEDLKFFRESTRGQVVVMGRKSFDSIGKPLPQRLNVVLTRDLGWSQPGVRVEHQLKSALENIQKTDTDKITFIIGGAEIYRLAMDLVDEVWLTEIEESVPGDAFFPYFENGLFQHPAFKKIRNEPQQDFSSSPLHYSFNYYSRIV